MPSQLQIGPQTANDGAVVNQRGDNFGNTVVQQFNGKYAELLRRGQAYLYTTPAQALVLSATTGGVPTIWNPAGSGKICYILQLGLGWLSGTNVAGTLLVGATANAGSSIGTAAPIATFTQVTQQGCGNPTFASLMKWSPTTNTFTAAPAIIATTGMNLAATQPTGVLQQDYDGALAIYPGNALSLCYSVTTSTALFYASVIAAEVSI
jgi:hypothetical protein